MSLSRTSNPLCRWPRLCSQLQPSRPLSTTTGHNKLPRASHNHAQHNNSNIAIPKRSRLFHSTPSPNAARSPTVRRSQGVRGTPISGEASPLYNQPVPGSKDNRIYFLAKNGQRLWKEAMITGGYDPIDLDDFKAVAYALCGEAFTAAPSGAVIWNISQDVDHVFHIGQIISVSDPILRQWILTACALAGVREAVYICAPRCLNKTKTGPAAQVLNNVKYLAEHERDPVAMTLHAQGLGLREDYHQALALMEEVIQSIRPVSSQPKDGFPLGSDSPWQVYGWLKRKTGDDAGVDEAVKTAALEYQEPHSLMVYAGWLMQQSDLELYEECMSKAAAAGHPDACRKLANFYLLTSIGRYPRRGEGEQLTAEGIEKEIAPQKWSLASLFNRSLPLGDYYKLAREWYEVACMLGSHDAAITFALLLRQESDFILGRHYLEMAAAKPDLASAIRAYRVNWDNEKVPMEVDFGQLVVS